MKKFKIFLILILLMSFFSIMNVNAKGKTKVKVYIYEAGGCPYCELQEEYLKGLDSYNKKFEIVKKELYVDHIDWEVGKDYNLGEKVANGFKKVGFENASYTETPFVVISDLYAATGYSTSLEEVINKAYENGDKDIVSCYEKGYTNCLDYLNKDNNDTKVNNVDIIIITTLCTIVIICTYIIKSNIDRKKIIEEISRNKDRTKKIKPSKKF